MIVQQRMNHIQRWMYRTLCQAAFSCQTRPYLPDDDELLSMLAGCESVKEWVANKGTVLRMFHVERVGEQDMWANNRVLADYARVMEKRQELFDRAVRGGQASAQARAQAHGSTISQPHAQPHASPPAQLDPTKGSEVKGSRREEVQDQRRTAESTTPPDFHPMQYATRLLEEISMPQTTQNSRVVAAAIVAEAKDRPTAQAYEFLLDKAKAAQADDVPIDKFWFEDRKWMPRKEILRGPTKTEQRIESVTRGRAAIVSGLGLGEDAGRVDAVVQDRAPAGRGTHMAKMLPGRTAGDD